MNIAVFCKRTTFHQEYGGMETQNKALCEGLVLRGHKVVVISPKWDFASDFSSQNGVDYYFIDASYRYLFANINKSSWFNKSYQKLTELNKSTKFDLILSQSSAGYGAIARKEILEIPIISIVHGSALGEFKTYFGAHSQLRFLVKNLLHLQYALRQFFFRQRQFILGSKRVIAVSSIVKKQLEEETFAPDSLITVIQNGVKPFEINFTNTSMPKLVYSGQLSVDKGVKLFLELADDPRFKNYEIDILGQGELFNDLKNKVSNVGLKINLLGKLSAESVVAKLKTLSGSLFVFPTRRIEGFPMVIIEAMFAGMPVVSYNLGGISDAVKDGVTGYLIDFENKEKFVKTTLDLLSNQDKLRDMGKSARSVAEQNFTLDIMLDKYEKVFAEVLKK